MRTTPLIPLTILETQLNPEVNFPARLPGASMPCAAYSGMDKILWIIAPLNVSIVGSGGSAAFSMVGSSYIYEMEPNHASFFTSKTLEGLIPYNFGLPLEFASRPTHHASNNDSPFTPSLSHRIISFRRIELG